MLLRRGVGCALATAAFPEDISVCGDAKDMPALLPYLTLFLPKQKYRSIDQDSRGYVRVSEDKGKNCLARSKPGGTGKFKRFKNTAEMQHCSIGYTGLLMTEVPFSEGGFLLQAADG